MAPATKRGREASDDGQRVGKKRKAADRPSGERRVPRSMKAACKEDAFTKFWSTFDVQFMVMQLMPAKDLLNLYNVCQIFRQHVQNYVTLHGRLFLTPDPGHKYVHTQDYNDELAELAAKAGVPTSCLPQGYYLTRPTPHLNDLIFTIIPKARGDFTLYDGPSSNGERGIHMGVTSDSLSPSMEIIASRVFDPRVPGWEDAPFQMCLEIQVWLDSRSKDQERDHWHEDSSCNAMFLTQPPIKEVTCWIEIRSWDERGRKSLPPETSVIRNGDGVTFGDVWEEVNRAKREAGAKLEKVERKPRRVGVQSARPGGA